jgi:hypothetical protein
LAEITYMTSLARFGGISEITDVRTGAAGHDDTVLRRAHRTNRTSRSNGRTGRTNGRSVEDSAGPTHGTPGRHPSGPGPAHSSRTAADRTDGSRRRRGLPLPERPKSPREAQPGGAPPDPTREEPNGGVTSGRAVPSTELRTPTTTPDIDLARSVGDAAGSSTRARQRGRPHLSRVRHHSSERGRFAPDDRHRRGHCPRHRRSPTADRPAGRSAAGPNQVRSRPTADPGSCGPPDRA